jgi:regulator of sigma E protease
VQVVPVRRPAGASHATIGVSVVDVAMVRLSFGSALRQGVVQTVHDTGSIVRSLGMLVAGVFKGSTNLLAQVAGPLGIAQIAGDAYAFGIGALLSFMAIISINLAVINLLPFPALDGGRFILELFARKGTSKIPLRIVGLINQIGFALLIVFAVMVTYHDILRLLA